MTRRIHLKIDKLVLRGVDARDQRAIAAGVARELLGRHEASSARDAGALPGDFATGCGAAIARQVARGSK